MPRFFFHVRDRDDTIRDAEGQEFADLEAARAEAVRVHREMLSEKLLHGGPMEHRRIEIADGDGKVLAQVAMRDVVIQDGELQAYPDDVAKTAPNAELDLSKPDERN